MILNNYKILIPFIVLINVFLLVGVYDWFFYDQETIIADVNEQCHLDDLRSKLMNAPFPKHKYVDKEDLDAYNDLATGKIMVVFFRSTCPACGEEFDKINQQYEEIAPKFRIVAITDESKGIVKQFLDEKKPKFPIYFDAEGGLMLQTRVTCTPTQFFLEDGKVTKITVGKIENYSEVISSL